MAKSTTAGKTAKKTTARKTASRKPAASKRKPAASTKSPYAAKPWLKSYPPDVPSEIGPLPHNSVAELLEDSCRKFSSRPVFSCMGKTITYSELLEQSSVVGAWLQAHGLKKGDRVAIMMPNILQYPAVMMGILRAGCTVVNVNPLYTPRELEHQLNDSGAKAIFILENFANTLQQVMGKTPVEHVVVTAMGDQMGGLKGTIVNFVVRKVKKMVPAWDLPGHTAYGSVMAGNGAGFATVPTSHDDVAFLQYTGGTTGVSKGAALSNSNVLSNAAQNALWVEVAYRKGGRPASLTYVCALPLYHIFALTVNAIMGMEQGAHNVLIPNPRDIPAFIKELGKWDFNVLPGLNTLFNAMMNNEDFAKLDFSGLRLTLGGGMAVQRPVAERWQQMTGCTISEGYGLSETSPVATANRFDAEEFSGTIGLPLPSTDIAIRDEKGKDLPLGEVGEICIRGPQVMKGYWNRSDETAKVMTKDGFFRSGDMGFMDKEGYTKIVDRKKDMILVSGFNVYPNEVEEVAASHEGIVEAAAIGVPDERSGEVVKLFVVRKDAGVSEDDVKAWCAKNLTNYKRPKYIEFREELPKTNVGKILRRKLRDE
ncbi:long-chain-fatty-acid--CoA ligase [Salaquimonas pukyongi]|uniref:long-chain-fatty-acid--CoA ligase n=1 Tax=Salaquimonas pukyongi TaxID=2712698 RepID=UPI0009FA5797|nr:long-chain-fatty-acid--CoA ligase [Salaquimonas pukyongi]